MEENRDRFHDFIERQTPEGLSQHFTSLRTSGAPKFDYFLFCESDRSFVEASLPFQLEGDSAEPEIYRKLMYFAGVRFEMCSTYPDLLKRADNLRGKRLSIFPPVEWREQAQADNLRGKPTKSFTPTATNPHIVFVWCDLILNDPFMFLVAVQQICNDHDPHYILMDKYIQECVMNLMVEYGENAKAELEAFRAGELLNAEIMVFETTELAKEHCQSLSGFRSIVLDYAAK